MVEGVSSERAGFWRRAAAAFIDMLVIAVPLSLIVPLLFAISGGSIQGSTGLDYSSCMTLKSYPPGLFPAPPENSNFANLCESYTLAGETGRTLVVGRTEKTPHKTSTVSRGYAVDRAGHIIAAHDISWAGWIAILSYVVLMQHRAGRTLGQRLLATRLAEASKPGARRIGWRPLAIRYGLLLGVFALPLLASSLLVAAGSGDEAYSSLYSMLLFMSIVWFTWFVWNTILVVRRRPTVYDWAAGLEILHVDRSASIPAPVQAA